MHFSLHSKQKALPLHRNYEKAIAQMAESVDALVSNTSGATHPGSIPGLGTKTEKVEKLSPFSFFYQLNANYIDKKKYAKFSVTLTTKIRDTNK